MERTDSKEYLPSSFSSSNAMSWGRHKGDGKRITSTDLTKVLMFFHVVPRKEEEDPDLKYLKSEILLKSHLLSEEAFKYVSDWVLGSHLCTKQPQLHQKLGVWTTQKILFPSKGRITTGLPRISSSKEELWSHWSGWQSLPNFYSRSEGDPQAKTVEMWTVLDSHATVQRRAGEAGHCWGLFLPSQLSPEVHGPQKEGASEACWQSSWDWNWKVNPGVQRGVPAPESTGG